MEIQSQSVLPMLKSLAAVPQQVGTYAGYLLVRRPEVEKEAHIVRAVQGAGKTHRVQGQANTGRYLTFYFFLFFFHFFPSVSRAARIKFYGNIIWHV